MPTITPEIRQAFRRDGAVVVRDCLSPEQLSACYEAFKWAVENPGPHHYRKLDGSALQTHIDNANPNAKNKLDALMETMPFAKIFQQIWDSDRVWYYAEEIFSKDGGQSGRGPWHQDTANLPWAGSHWGNAWVSFQKLPKKNALQVIRGSHLGIQYDGSSFANPDDPTEPLYGDGSYPRLPDIDKELAADPNSWDVMSFDINPGDVLFLHPRSLHGGAPVDEDCPTRHTIVFRFFGDNAQFRPLPEGDAIKPRYARNGPLFSEQMANLNSGDAFRSSIFRQVI